MDSIEREVMMPRRRANGQGSIHLDKRSGKYRVTYTVERNKKTGKLIRKSFSALTYEEAEERLQAVLLEIKEGNYKIEADMKFKDWISYWLNDCKVNTIERTTLENYRRNIKNHIIPWLGNIKLKDISVKELQQFYNYLYEEGREDGTGGLNPRTVQRIHTIINSALKHAVRCEVITKNVAQYVIKRKMKKHQIDPYTPEELKKFINLIKDEDLYPIFMTSAFTGLRRGEVLALRWQDVDLNNRIINVKKSIGQVKVNQQEKKRIIELKDTKTESSKRCIPIDNVLVEVLTNHRKQQIEVGFKYGIESYNTNNLVFCEKDGSFINPSKYTNEFIRVIEENKLRRIRLHDLRHTYASILLNEGVGHNSIKDLLGHSTVVTTLDIYAHTNIAELRKASSKLTEALMS